MATDTLAVNPGDQLIKGALEVRGSVVVPQSSFGDREFKSSDPLTGEKQEHLRVLQLSQISGTAAADATWILGSARFAGTIEAVKVSVLVAAIGDSTVTVDIKKNGTTILSGLITVDSGDAAYAQLSGTLATTTYVAGDVFTVVLDATVGTGTLPQGISAELFLHELGA